MKSLQDYIKDEQTALFKKYGVFFAFSVNQYINAAVEGTRYVSAGSGMFCPAGNEKALYKDLKNLYEKGIAQDLAENGKEAIIRRELSNYECQLTGDVTDAYEALEDYGITFEEVQEGYASFYKECVENGWF